MKNLPWKKILLVLAIGLVGYVIYSVYQAIKSGEKTISGVILAPFTALADVWDSITGLFSFGSNAAPAVSVLGSVQQLENLGFGPDSPLVQEAQIVANPEPLINGVPYSPVQTGGGFFGL